VDFMKGGRDKMLWDILPDFDVLWTTKERRQQHCGNYTCVKSSWFFKMSNRFQVDNLITNKSVANLRSLLKNSEYSVCQNFCSCKCEQILKTYDVVWINALGKNKKEHNMV